MIDDFVLGIDLGTTNSNVTFHRKDSSSFDIINFDGKDYLPSIVKICTNAVIVGHYIDLEEDPKNTFYCIKRILGRRKNDPNADKEAKTFPFRVDFGQNGLPNIYVNMKKMRVPPEFISSFVLNHIKETVQRTQNFSSGRFKVVLAVPANFNDFQRRATQDAAKIAGLEPIGVITEPTAASIAHIYHSQTKKNYILVYDFGGGTLDVSLVHYYQSSFTVIATSGDTHCGGHDIDQCLLEEVVKKIKEENNVDLNEIFLFPCEKQLRNAKIKAALLSLCEDAKIKLSSQPSIEIEYNYPGVLENFKYQISDNRIHEIIYNMKDKLINPIEDVIQATKNPDLKQNLEVIFVGGSSQVPAVKELIRDTYKNRLFFDSSDTSNVNTSSYISEGAAIYAAYKLNMLTNHQIFYKLSISDVTPLNLNIAVNSGKLIPALFKNTPIPKDSEWIPFDQANYDNNEVKCVLYEGQSNNEKDCYKVGTYNYRIPQIDNYGRVACIEMQVSIKEDTSIELRVRMKPRDGGNQIKAETLHIQNQEIRSPQELEELQQLLQLWCHPVVVDDNCIDKLINKINKLCIAVRNSKNAKNKKKERRINVENAKNEFMKEFQINDPNRRVNSKECETLFNIFRERLAVIDLDAVAEFLRDSQQN